MMHAELESSQLRAEKEAYLKDMYEFRFTTNVVLMSESLDNKSVDEIRGNEYFATIILNSDIPKARDIFDMLIHTRTITPAEAKEMFIPVFLLDVKVDTYSDQHKWLVE